MAIKALTLSATARYESPDDPAKGTPEATVFTLGPVDVFVTSHVFDKALEYRSGRDEIETSRFLMNEMTLEWVRFGLRGWERFEMEDGSHAPFRQITRVVAGREYKVAADECVAMIPLGDIRRMATEIRSLNQVSKVAAKNSDSAP